MQHKEDLIQYRIKRAAQTLNEAKTAIDNNSLQLAENRTPEEVSSDFENAQKLYRNTLTLLILFDKNICWKRRDVESQGK